VGSEAVAEACAAEERPDADALAELLRPHLLRRFRPAFLGRLTVVPFFRWATRRSARWWS
jgi:type VI secretion system protein VasG